MKSLTVGYTVLLVALVGAGAGAWQQGITIQIPKSNTLLNTLHQVGQQQSAIVVAEIKDDSSLRTPITPGEYPVDRVLSEARTRLAAKEYKRSPDGSSIYFESNTSAPMPELPMTREFQQSLKLTENMDDLLGSFSQDQMNALKSSGFQLAAESLTPDQRSRFQSLASSLGTSVGNTPFFNLPNARVSLEFRTHMIVWPQEGNTLKAIVGNSASPNQ